MKRIFTLFLVLAAFVAAQAATYTVAGSGAVLNGESWKQDNAANDMTSADNENYTLTISGISVEAGSYEFKVVEDHAWTNCWPSSNYKFDITETAKYDIVYTFNATSKEITVTPTKVGAFEGSTDKTYTVAGTGELMGTDWKQDDADHDMVKGDDGIYRLTLTGVTLAAKDYKYKVTVNHDWGVSYPSSDAVLTIAEAGTYDVTFTFDEGTKAVNATAAAPAPVATGAVFDIQNNNGNWGVGEGADFEKGNFSTLTMDGVVLTNIQGSSMNPARIMKNDSKGIFLQCFKNIALKFNAPEGKAITKVEVTMQSGSFDMTPSTGAVEENVWTGNATEVTFENTKGTRYVWKFVVTIADENAETVKPVSAVEVENIAAFNALEDGVDAKLTLTNARVNGYWDLRGAYYVEDATGAFAIKGLTLTPGTVLNGTISGKKASDKTIDMDENVMEICINATDASTFTATETTLEGTAMAIDAIGTQANYGKLITVENVEITGSGQNKTLTDADGKTIKARDFFAVLPADFAWPAKASKLTGVLVFNVTGWFLAPVSAEAIVADTADGIIDLKAEAADKAIYNLQGIRLQQLKKGPNIVDGKVVIVK